MTLINKKLARLIAVVFTSGAAGAAHAEIDARTWSPYSLPWQLRPVTIDSLVRVEGSAAAFNDDNGNLDLAVATVLAGSYQLTDHWAPMMRLGFAVNDAPGAARDGSSFANPTVGVTYARQLGGYDLALFGATTIPVGSGGGNDPNVRAAKTNAAAATTRPADDAMFAVNYLTATLGADLAYVDHGFTAQTELTLQQSVRVRGDDNGSAIDLFRTNAAFGLNLGYFIGSHFSLGADVRYQRWLSAPTVRDPETGAHVPMSDAKLDTLTVAAGLRVHIELSPHAWAHPGLAVMRGFDARGLDVPLLVNQPTAVVLDIPVMFE